jgi:hypothetical protein
MEYIPSAMCITIAEIQENTGPRLSECGRQKRIKNRRCAASKTRQVEVAYL